MGLRQELLENLHYEPKVPDNKTIIEQAKMQLKQGKSTGSIKLDMAAMKAMRKDKER